MRLSPAFSSTVLNVRASAPWPSMRNSALAASAERLSISKLAEISALVNLLESFVVTCTHSMRAGPVASRLTFFQMPSDQSGFGVQSHALLVSDLRSFNSAQTLVIHGPRSVIPSGMRWMKTSSSLGASNRILSATSKENLRNMPAWEPRNSPLSHTSHWWSTPSKTRLRRRSCSACGTVKVFLYHQFCFSG